MKCFKKIVCTLLLISICVINFDFINYSNNTLAGQEMRTQVLYLAGIIDNDLNLNEYINRAEFAKMIAKTSTYKDSISKVSLSDVFNDVKKDNPYAQYIKLVAKEGYINAYLGGMFRPEYPVSYRDLVRAVVALLGYTDEDFANDKLNGRYELFCSLELNDSIEKNIDEYVTKVDCVNAIYNMLKAKTKNGQVYGTTTFDLSVNTDGELNASGLLKVKMRGPFIFKRGDSLSELLPFDVNEGNYFLNGAPSSFSYIQTETSKAGFTILYYNETTKTVYAYEEGTSLDTTVNVTKGYVTHIYYNASDNLTPASVEIERARYYIGNSEVKFALSYAGTIGIGDQVVFIYEKSNDTESDNDTNYVGTITSIYLYNVLY